MNKKLAFRWLMLLTGLVTAGVLTLSNLVDHDSLKEKAKTEHAAEDSPDVWLIPQPSDVVLAAATVQLHQTADWVIEVLFCEPAEKEVATGVPVVFNSCFRFLSGASIIAPNAP